jgi:hypothetical protein
MLLLISLLRSMVLSRRLARQRTRKVEQKFARRPRRFLMRRRGMGGHRSASYRVIGGDEAAGSLEPRWLAQSQLECCSRQQILRLGMAFDVELLNCIAVLLLPKLRHSELLSICVERGSEHGGHIAR